MKFTIGRLATILVLINLVCSCDKVVNSNKEALNISTAEYELIVPERVKGMLMVLPCYPCTIESSATEFSIDSIAISRGYGIMRMAFNQRLWLSEKEKQQLKELIESVLTENGLVKVPLFIGGFSSGGNIALLLANYLEDNESVLPLKGIYVVDAPVDLGLLWSTALLNLERDSSNLEAQMIHRQFTASFGGGDSSRYAIKQVSPLNAVAKNPLKNLQALKRIAICLYTESDTSWWRQNRGVGYRATNSYPLELMYQEARKTSEFGIEFIRTTDKGYRVDGSRHPHSWSIVDKKELITWMDRQMK
ncbi:MAG: hypothetical protein ACI9L9_001036 [Marivirga sp.]|jgi:hypothetical protein